MHTRSLLPAVMFCCLTLSGCTAMLASQMQGEQQQGSLTRTYKLIDEMGRVSGTLTIQPMGRAELRDADGSLIGVFSADQGFTPKASH